MLEYRMASSLLKKNTLIKEPSPHHLILISLTLWGLAIGYGLSHAVKPVLALDSKQLGAKTAPPQGKSILNKSNNSLKSWKLVTKSSRSPIIQQHARKAERKIQPSNTKDLSSVAELPPLKKVWRKYKV